MKTVLRTLLFLLVATPTFALEYFPEFGSLTEAEQAGFDAPKRLGSEYQSDVLAFSRPIEWGYELLSNPKVLDVSVGSTGPEYFLIDNHVKLQVALTDFLEFRFTFIDERNQDRESVHHIFELIYWPRKKWGVSVYTEPSLFKREDDFGVAVLYKPSNHHEIRLFNTLVDMTRIRRNNRNDTFDKSFKPAARGIVFRQWSDPATKEKDFLQVAFRYETKTKWIFPDELYHYIYWKTFAQTIYSKAITNNIRGQIKFQYDQKYEERLPQAGSTVTPEAWRTDRWYVTLQTILYDFLGNKNWELTPGVEYAQRYWKTSPADVIYRDLIPHVWLKFPSFSEPKIKGFWKLGLDTTWHQERGPVVLRSPSGRGTHPNNNVEYRFNLVYQLNFAPMAKLIVLGSADLDSFSWEGGNMQFQLLF